MAPFEEDDAVCRVAESLGLELSRYEAIEVTDEGALVAAGMTCQKPDYQKIRKALREGEDVPGVRVKGIEYILRRPE